MVKFITTPLLMFRRNGIF